MGEKLSGKSLNTGSDDQGLVLLRRLQFTPVGRKTVRQEFKYQRRDQSSVLVCRLQFTPVGRKTVQQEFKYQWRRSKLGTLMQAPVHSWWGKNCRNAKAAFAQQTTEFLTARER
ncbi:hypothetical protein M5K25_011835 [Dendrobium thyrsiflorum]|uniref:Uncharacterized protein n=1 Tax=Dendrobium thyrsiflorum TaxID=117978 RepID=A0ABD0V3R9_DENTH